ncbi:MAG: hypothetical protein JOZ54_18125, partial [Acidobacteria bacterium]|nr:hypothetical protein [Acidobacteriota bacterium]
MNGDVTIAMHAADATRVFPLDGRAQDGTPLVDLPRDGARRHTVALRAVLHGFSADILNLGDARAIRLGSLSNRIRLAPLESYLDPETPRFYALMHRELTGGGSPLTVANAEHARVRWTADDRVDASADMLYPGGADALSTVRIDTVSGAIANGRPVDIFLTRDLTLNASATITLRGERIALSGLSARLAHHPEADRGRRGRRSGVSVCIFWNFPGARRCRISLRILRR